MTIELALLCQMCDLHFKLRKIGQKLRSLSRQIGTRSDKLALQVIFVSVKFHELHWTDKNVRKRNNVSLNQQVFHYNHLAYSGS